MSKDKYKVRNWQAYNRGLKERGKVCLWINEMVLSGWYQRDGPVKRGRPRQYSDQAIETCLTIRKVFHLALRQCEGFLTGLFNSLKIDLPVPNYTVLCRRAGQLKLSVTACTSGEAIDLIVDSTGLKVYGEGEWKVRKHGAGKHRTWMKLHLGIEAGSQQIVFSELTTNAIDDGEVVKDLATKTGQPIKSFTGDGAYDKTKVRKMLYTARIKQVIPPQHNAVINLDGETFLRCRNKAIKDISTKGRKEWKVSVNYHKRSLSETAMFRYKTIIGADLQSRSLENQQVETKISCNILNRMLQLIKPQSYKIIKKEGEKA